MDITRSHSSPVEDGSSSASRSYALGYSDGEFRRLEMQSQLFGDLTEDVLRRAGIARGMRVLDVGCGVGDVSLMAAKMVGPGGFVLGVDQSPDAIAVAERRTVEAGMCHWTHFAAASLDSLEPSIRFDAVIGRLILMYLPDPAATLRRLASFVIRGGIVAFHEMAMTPTRSVPDVAEYDLCRYRIIETFKRAGFETDMAGKLYSTFLKAGLPAPTMIAAGRVRRRAGVSGLRIHRHHAAESAARDGTHRCREGVAGRHRPSCRPSARGGDRRQWLHYSAADDRRLGADRIVKQRRKVDNSVDPSAAARDCIRRWSSRRPRPCRTCGSRSPIHCRTRKVPTRSCRPSPWSGRGPGSRNADHG